MKGRFCFEDFNSVMLDSKWNQPVQTIHCDNQEIAAGHVAVCSHTKFWNQQIWQVFVFSVATRKGLTKPKITSTRSHITVQSIPGCAFSASSAAYKTTISSAITGVSTKWQFGLKLFRFSCFSCVFRPYWPAFLMFSGIISKYKLGISTFGPNTPENRATIT